MCNPTTPNGNQADPDMIEKRISMNSCNEIEFARSLPSIYGRADTSLSLLLTQIHPIRNLAATENTTLLGSTPHLTIKFPPTLVKFFSTSYVNISHPTIGYTKSVTKIISNLAIAAHPTWETS